ncbi:phosphate ABC transporter substrate-binding protein [Hymenobacter metallicola]|uniref:Phosphate ABC transporter substrate-binding protein n=1 Tax=Hymenobacter metallicola TaxID=2563114 RepID=A0A4Z0QJP3_9BACT|nr:phosphate ABC transporter substrate-binding protein [Hymenobacter metallicola]TGE29231.1 phosphate ABC transporter substrate-binding protein [Hymenobacter metallicola]
MKRVKQLQQAFGTVEEGSFVAFPAKFSNVQVSRVIFGNARGCAVCFPHGPETDNATLHKRERSWKRFRRTQWKR